MATARATCTFSRPIQSRSSGARVKSLWEGRSTASSTSTWKADTGDRMRNDGRKPDEMRPVRITGDYLAIPEGSALIEVGNTRVICTASIEEAVPPFLRNSGKGWITSEYA